MSDELITLLVLFIGVLEAFRKGGFGENNGELIYLVLRLGWEVLSLSLSPSGFGPNVFNNCISVLGCSIFFFAKLVKWYSALSKFKPYFSFPFSFHRKDMVVLSCYVIGFIITVLATSTYVVFVQIRYVSMFTFSITMVERRYDRWLKLSFVVYISCMIDKNLRVLNYCFWCSPGSLKRP